MTRHEIEQKMDELARDTTTPTTRKSQKRFLKWLGGLVNWGIDGGLNMLIFYCTDCNETINCPSQDRTSKNF